MHSLGYRMQIYETYKKGYCKAAILANKARCLAARYLSLAA